MKRFIYNLWWKYQYGTEIIVEWPSGQINDSFLHSADPNDHYRPWLEEHVGRQSVDWDWAPTWSTYVGTDPGTSLQIIFRKGKEKYASIAALKWG